jgi:diguanylate cyclase (GGDEF)-like protein
MATLAFVLSLSLTLAVLGLAAARRRAAAARLKTKRARPAVDLVQPLLAASRSSGSAVIASLDRIVRDGEPSIDAVLFFIPVGDELECVYTSGLRAEHFQRLRLRRDAVRCLPARAARDRCRAVAPRDGDSLLPTDRFALAVPLIDARELRGALYVSSFSSSSIEVESIVRAVETAATPYAIGLERELDRTDAMHDGLTGLLTAQAFRRHLHDELAKAPAARGSDAALWFVDTDSFKGVNDRFGHRAGDAVLQGMAVLLRAQLTPGIDVAARNGGDEFCALIRGACKRAAIERALRFCSMVRNHDFGLAVHITASIGVATFPTDASTSSELLEAADGAMYYSKRNGRDRVSFVLGPGRYACAPAEAESEASRS